MAFAQLSFRVSLHSIQACLRASQQKLYHMGFRSKVSRNTLSHANQIRDWRIYDDFSQILIHHARKLHILPDLHGNIPALAIITHGIIHDVNIDDSIIMGARSIYIMDRGYMDCSRLYKKNQSQAFFIIRAKRNFKFKRLYSHAIDKSMEFQFDQTIVLKGFYTKQDYPEKLRRIRFLHAEKNKRLVFLTNNFILYFGCNYKKRTEKRSQSLHNSTDFKCFTL